MKKIALVFALFSLLSAGSVPAFAQSSQEMTAEEMNDMGDMYYKGDSIPQDYAEALKWFTQSAEKGN
ncbi:MAG: SEL1-like repeat protein, partial [Prevotellaceae bacterium]|nr:SEL1-like repeat protein [Prevotellaceae bacterium]